MATPAQPRMYSPSIHSQGPSEAGNAEHSHPIPQPLTGSAGRKLPDSNKQLRILLHRPP